MRSNPSMSGRVSWTRTALALLDAMEKSASLPVELWLTSDISGYSLMTLLIVFAVSGLLCTKKNSVMASILFLRRFFSKSKLNIGNEINFH